MRPATTKRALARALLSTTHRRLQTTTSTTTPITSVLIANRGEIALRVGRTAAQHGIKCTTIYTDPDATSQHALSSPFSINLGPPSAYLDGEKIISVAKEQGCQALHPGYGFLSENSEFAKRCGEEGLVFIGPPWKAIEAMGNKSRSKDIMIAAGVPCIPGYHGANQNPEYLLEEAKKIGFPVLVKAVRGGGGKGMRICMNEEEFFEKLDNAKSEGRNSFGDDEMLVEKYITTPRHIEVQIFADKFGNAVALGERDCSLQRRHQKILEEAPAPNLAEDIRQDLWGKGRAAALAVGYEGAGTVECKPKPSFYDTILTFTVIFDNDTNKFYFMEMNTRLQVEHPVTEAVTGEDLVSWQFKVAAGEPLPLTQEQIAERIRTRGWAFEARIYAEDPAQNFMPDAGKLIHLKTPAISDSVRIDAGFVEGDTISSAYDPMIAKLIVSGETREIAIRKMYAALQDYEVVGINTNIEFLKRVCKSPDFIAGEVETGYIGKHHDELFAEVEVPHETYVQAALSLLLSEAGRTNQGPHGQSLYNNSTTTRSFQFTTTSSNTGNDLSKAITTVEITQTSPTTFNTTITSPNNTTQTYDNLTSTLSASDGRLTTYYPSTRLSTLTIPHTNASSSNTTNTKLTIFTPTTTHTLTHLSPPWLTQALGKQETSNSVLAPMPCKILRNLVQTGEEVTKGQALVVIESMKMETVIKSPVAGKVERLAHGEGDVCKAGTVLVVFEEQGKDDDEVK